MRTGAIVQAMATTSLSTFLKARQQTTKERAIMGSCNRAMALRADYYRQRRQDTVPPSLVTMTDLEDHLRARYERCLDALLGILIAHPPQVCSSYYAHFVYS